MIGRRLSKKIARKINSKKHLFNITSVSSPSSSFFNRKFKSFICLEYRRKLNENDGKKEMADSQQLVKIFYELSLRLCFNLKNLFKFNLLSFLSHAKVVFTQTLCYVNFTFNAKNVYVNIFKYFVRKIVLSHTICNINIIVSVALYVSIFFILRIIIAKIVHFVF
jgi:hypothetical protein